MTSYRGRILKKILRASMARLRKRKPKTLEEYRRRLDEIAKRIPVTPGVKVDSTMIKGCYAEWLIPLSRKFHDASTIFYLHGGGYSAGSTITHRALGASIAKKSGVRVLLLEYRLAPEHPFPAALEDAVATYQWLLEQGCPPERIAFAGDSAGAGLCIATTLYLRDHNLPLPKAIACISPWVDLLHSGESHKQNAAIDPLLVTSDAEEVALYYTDAENLRNPLISPIYANLQGLPPVLIQVGSEEILLDDAKTLAQKIKEVGGEIELKIWEGMWHVWHIAGMVLPESEKALEEIAGFLRAQIDK